MRNIGVDSKQSWVVAVASGLLFLLVSLPLRMGSLLFVSIMERYDVNRKDSSFPFMLAYLMRSLSGPFAGYFGQLFGLKTITLLGCLFCSISVAACYLADNIIAIDIFLGVIFGIGYGWSTALVPEILNQNFKKHRAKANGIFFGASGIGASIAPPILDIILLRFGVSETFLLLSGIILNSVPAAMLLTIPRSELERKNSSNKSILKCELPLNEQLHSVCLSENTKIDLSEANHLKTHRESDINKEDSFKLNDSKENKLDCPSQDLKEHPILHSACKLNYQSFSTVQKDVETESKVTAKTSSNISCGSFSVLLNPLFLLITSITSSNNYVVYIFWTITIDLVRDKGVEQHLEVYFVIVLSLMDTLGRFFLASVTDSKLMTVQSFSACCFAVMGLSCMLLVWLSGFWAIMFSICLISLVSGGNTTSQPGIVTEFISGEKRSMALASRLIMYAPMSFTVPYLIGYFRGVEGSYDGLLYVMTSMCVVCCILLMILPKFAKCCT